MQNASGFITEFFVSFTAEYKKDNIKSSLYIICDLFFTFFVSHFSKQKYLLYFYVSFFRYFLKDRSIK